HFLLCLSFFITRSLCLFFFTLSLFLSSPSHRLSFAFLSFPLSHSFNPNFHFVALLHVAFCIFSTLTLLQPQCPSAPAATGLRRKLLELGRNDKLRGGDCRAGNHRFDLIELKRRRRHLKGLS
ncbi:hypothetical protein V8G54_018530, partial [Vigna mungo]